MFPKTAVRCLAPLLLLALLTGCGPRDVKSEKAGRPAQAPPTFKVKFETSKGEIVVEVTRDLAPHGADRFHDLVASRFYDGARFFRVVRNFVAQFGLSGDPKLNDAWRVRCIADEPVKHTNSRGTIAYARGGPGTRSVQIFVNLRDNARLDSLAGFGFPPIAEVVSGMDLVDSLYSGYGEGAPRSGPQPGREGPNQDSISRQGNAYLQRGWPKLDYVKSARVVREWRSPSRDTARR